jgi:hypothetical protein
MHAVAAIEMELTVNVMILILAIGVLLARLYWTGCQLINSCHKMAPTLMNGVGHGFSIVALGIVLYYTAGPTIHSYGNARWMAAQNSFAEFFTNQGWPVLLPWGCILGKIVYNMGYNRISGAINGVRTRSPVSPSTTVIVQPSPILNIAGPESLPAAIAQIIQPRDYKGSATESQKQADDRAWLEDRLMQFQEKLTKAFEDLKSQVDRLPQINALATSLMEVVDIVQEEGATMRQTVREGLARYTPQTLGVEVGNKDPETEEVMVAVAGVHKQASNQELMQRTIKARAIEKPDRKKLDTKKPEQIQAGSQNAFTQDLARPEKELSILNRPWTEQDLQQFVGKPLAEIAAKVSIQERDRKLALKTPEFLTEIEKETGKISLSTLDRQWRELAGWKIKPTDYIEIGTLNNEQVNLPRTLVRRIIRDRRAQDFMDRMREEGRETVKCEKCHRLYPADGNHNCFIASGWSSTKQRDGLPVTKQMVISQMGKGGIQIRPTVGVNAERLNENFQKLARFKLVLDDAHAPTMSSQAITATPANSEGTSALPTASSIPPLSPETRNTMENSIDEQDHEIEVNLGDDPATVTSILASGKPVFRLVPY